MSTSTDIIDLICDIVKNDIQEQLLKVRRSRAWDGKAKPVNGGYAGYVGALSQRKNTGLLYESVTVKPLETEDGLAIDISFPGADYAYYVNYGRRGKKNSPTVKYPPLSAIENWISQKGLPQFRDRRGRFISNRQRAFMVQASIGEYGIAPTFFLQEGLKASDERIKYYLGEYGKRLFNELFTGLEN